MDKLFDLFESPGRVLLTGAPEGLDALALTQLVRTAPAGALHVARDDARLARIAEAVAFFAPDIDIVRFPAWDCLPYDRVSPNGEIAAERCAALAALASDEGDGKTRLVLTTVNAVTQRVPARDAFAAATFALRNGDRVDLDALRSFLARNGYSRSETVREPGEFALRGGIIDIFPPDGAEPMRLDLFGDTLERVRVFDPASQISSGDRDGVTLRPVSEVFLDDASIGRFRTGYRDLFGAVGDDPLYAAISEGRKQIGMEHWLPLFHERLETLFDYVPEAVVTLDHQVDEARAARLETVNDYYEARESFIGTRSESGDSAPPYRPLPPARLYIDDDEWQRLTAGRRLGQFVPFAMPRDPSQRMSNLGGRRMESFTARQAPAGNTQDKPVNAFDAVRAFVSQQRSQRRRIAIAGYSVGSRERLRELLVSHGSEPLALVDRWEEVDALPLETIALVVLALENGFTSPEMALIGEQDILGERLVRPQRRRRAEQFLADVSDLAPGDLVVHVEHGIGRYEGIETITVSGAPHDCLRLTYDGGDRLFVPVENLELLSRYGSADAGAALDRLGGAGWQSRKARLKKRLRDMADALIKVAAERALKPADVIETGHGLYDEFSARFPYEETDDQNAAITDTLADLSSGHAMDRLICGDVGFGKTEVALRAAFATVMSGGQVAVVVPTTLLARQHFRHFRERFQGFGARVEQLSRLVGGREAAAIKAGLADGSVDIVIGTHALLSAGISFRNLKLLVVDEEQHFGVAHKEKLKQLKTNVHVLTLTATPIPRTLQLALTGVRELSMIATPPVDRLAVRTFVLPYDPVVVREAIMREHFRGGQVFYVCPRIEDLDGVAERLRKLVPEIRIRIAHGRLGSRELEKVMTAFYAGEFDLLLSTQIVESGLDIPTANTLIVHRADMFGLAQLYQLRGRIGRSKLRGYAYLTLPPNRVLTPSAEKRLQVLQALDTLGAGFSLASHDLDIRGAGNLLGEEQSGHIREVGAELYQHMLEEAVQAARGGAAATEEEWTPQINIGIPVLIPEAYVSDLGVRLGLYRRIAHLIDGDEIAAFRAEMIDRFGPLPAEVENLLAVVAIKRLCREAGVEKFDAGPKGAVIAFHANSFANPAGLVEFITTVPGHASLRPDHRLVYRQDWENAKRRLAGAQEVLARLAAIATQTPEPAPQ